MHPDLFGIGAFHVKTYGACMALGFLLCWKLIERLSGRRDLGDLLLALMAGGVAGGRIAYVIEHWQSEFAGRPLQILRVDQGGLMFYGGLIAAILVFFVWCAVKRDHPLALADVLCTALPLGHAFGRVGCFFYGCCYGRLDASPLAVSFPPHSPAWMEQYCAGRIPASAAKALPVLPTQLIEAAALLALFAVLLALYRFHRPSGAARGRQAGLYLVGYACIRFGLEYLRGDPRAAWAGLSVGQLISLGVAALGAVFLTLSFRRAPEGGS